MGRCSMQEAGVACYWVVDLDEKAIEAWTPDATFPAVEREQVVWRPAGATDALVIPIAEILPPAEALDGFVLQHPKQFGLRV